MDVGQFSNGVCERLHKVWHPNMASLEGEEQTDLLGNPYPHQLSCEERLNACQIGQGD